MMLQRRAVRIVAKQYYKDDTDHLFSRLRILKIESVNKFLIAEFMYKYERKLLPQVFDGYVLHSYQIHSYNTRSQDNFRSTYCCEIRNWLGTLWSAVVLISRHFLLS